MCFCVTIRAQQHALSCFSQNALQTVCVTATNAEHFLLGVSMVKRKRAYTTTVPTHVTSTARSLNRQTFERSPTL